ncbi:hypothetical protein R3P38DRAFT_3098070 [Favolaschia claudopus]|uniref:BTB domain-containing protein n=1 Tax=Favolaschia claudopus TaxID=2862362 RepID=A0AAV9ZNI8_9AGAR
MAEAQPSSPLFKSTAPFDDPKADTILRSSDGVDFRVYRVILSSASPFFKTMFSLPQDTSEDSKIPTVPFSETGRILDRFLRIWYPGATTAGFDSLEQLADVIQLALGKYDLQYLAPILNRQLRVYVENHCVSVFAIACRYGWKASAKLAAKQALNLDLPSIFNSTAANPYLRHITGDQFQALLIYHHACGKAAAAAGRLLPWSDAEYAWNKCTVTSCAACGQYSEIPGRGRVVPRAWIFTYLDEASAALKQRPGANVQNPALLVGAQSKAMSCSSSSHGGYHATSPCRSHGLQDLSKFVTDKYVPAVNEAIKGVLLQI